MTQHDRGGRIWGARLLALLAAPPDWLDAAARAIEETPPPPFRA